jgi:hypothetical protein
MVFSMEFLCCLALVAVVMRLPENFRVRVFVRGVRGGGAAGRGFEEGEQGVGCGLGVRGGWSAGGGS